MIREINDKSPVITTPISQLEGSKILDVMEHPQSLEQEMMEEEVCPVCGGHHDHHHDHEECGCGHDHHHDHEECHDHHHHDHEEECHGHHHDHEEECHGHHHDHEECGCGHDHHHHDHEECGCGHEHHAHHHADEVFTSWGRETVKTYTKGEIEEILKKLETEGIQEEGSILRAKGMVAGQDGQWIYFDMVPGEHEVRQGAPEFTGRLCVIGARLNEEKLAELFGL